VHGTDIFNKLIELFKKDLVDSKIDLSFHGIAKTNIYITSEKPKNEKLIKFVFKYKNDTQNNVWFGFENNKKIDCRYEYPEEKIYQLSNLDFNNNTITLNTDSSYSFIENIVAMNKYLLENIFKDISGKWYFTRLQIAKNVHKNYPLKLELKANFNFKLTKTAIFIDDQLVGYLYFSLV